MKELMIKDNRTIKIGEEIYYEYRRNKGVISGSKKVGIF